jgi:hypothetical protein
VDECRGGFTNSEDYGMSDGDDYGLKVCAYPFVRNGS